MKAFVIVLFSLFVTVASARPFGVTSSSHSSDLLSSITRLSGGGRRNKKRIPTQIVICAFSDSAKADKAADLLKDAAEAGILYFRNLAVIRKYINGSVVIHETGDMKIGYAATVGMFVGGMSLLLLGPAGVLAGGAAGALLGGAAQAMLDEAVDQEYGESSLDKHRLEEVGEILTRGSSALVVVFEEVLVNKGKTKPVKLKLTQDIVLLDLEAKMRQALDKGKDVAFAVTILEDRISAVRMVTNKRATDIKGMMITKKGRSVGRAHATGEGISYEVAKSSQSGSSYKTGAVNYDRDVYPAA
jgi:uncharacterized membrane protein